jgi:hypothetical protein
MASHYTEVPDAHNCRWSCSVCGQPVPLVLGRSLCPSCGCPFTVKIQDRTGRVYVTGLNAVHRTLLEEAPGSVCAEHADRAAAGVCERCGQFACAECSRFKDGRRYCPGCIPLVRRQVAQEARRKSLIIAAVAVGAYLLWLIASVFVSLTAGP